MITFEHFGDSQAQAAQKLVDFYEGTQLKYLIRTLDGFEHSGAGARSSWRERGFVPRVRNIVKPIVEKSATLFQKPAKFEILPEGSATAKPVVDARFNQLLMHADGQEFFKTVDVYTRLLKATCVLQQKYVNGDRDTAGGVYRFDATLGDEMVPELLHRGNSVVIMNRTRTHILELAFLTSGSWLDEEWSYRHITPTMIRDVTVRMGKEYVTENDNPDGIVPAVMFYDTGKPRSGVWPKIPEDLASIQELINSHLTDMEFALANGKSQKLVLKNAVQIDPTKPAETGARVVESFDDNDRRLVVGPPKPDTVVGGIGSVIHIKDAQGAGSADAGFIGPDVDLSAHQEVIKGLVMDLATDWSVNLKVGGGGTAASGFSLIVQEMDNLTLREQRAQAFQAALRRFYEITYTLYPELTRGQLQVIFSEASLPVNKIEQQQLWEQKIASGFASVIDYLMEIEGLDQAEAIRRAAEIKAFNDMNKEPVPEALEEQENNVQPNVEERK